MQGEQLMIAACRNVIENNGAEKAQELLNTEIGLKRYALAKRQLDLEKKFLQLFESLKRVYVLAQSTDDERYINEFLRLEEEITRIYTRLAELDYEKSYAAACCPLIEEIENNVEVNGNVDQ